jgi:CrcB protein
MAALLVAVGGAIGSLLRYLVTVALAGSLGAAFPYGTLVVNLGGSFLLGVLAEAFGGATILGVDARLVLGVGLLGGFTTYSSFNLELLRLVEEGMLARAALYLGTTLLGCLAAGALGLAAARLLAAR